MDIIAKVGKALDVLFGNAEIAASASKVIKRKRKFTVQSLAKTFVVGFLQNPKASDEQLAQMAAQCGTPVSPQAVEQRFTPELVDFLERLFRDAVKLVIGSDRTLAPILERFRSVTIIDSSVITLPSGMKDQFPGCGGGRGGGDSAMKIQTELDLRSGAIGHIEIESGRSTDGATCRQHVSRGEGSLRISDLGYYNVEVFTKIVAAKEHFLSRLQCGTQVMLPDGQELELVKWLESKLGPFVDEQVVLSKTHRLPCRLIAWRLPEEQANKRRQKLRQEMLRKHGTTPSKERLAWCDWTILVTSVPAEILTPEEAVILYRGRWQVELLFKRWKSQGLVDVLSGSTEVRQMVRIWARLLSALVQHWLLVATAWGNSTKSLTKISEAIRAFAGRIAAALPDTDDLKLVLRDICAAVASTCRRDKRTRPGTFELLNDPSLLEYR